MTQITMTPSSTSFQDQPVEIVERKGIGHPDTICDALAEELSRSLCRFYLENFGLILHHNVDKVLLWGGSSQSAFGGGKVLAPMEIFMAGRATCEYKGIKVPLQELVENSCHRWLNSHLHELDVDHHTKIHSLNRPGSSDLVELYLRQQQTGIALANDTSCGVGYAPLSELESVVLEVEQRLNSAEFKSHFPEVGEDIKVMGIKRDKHLDLTVACAFIDRYISDTQDYQQKKIQLEKQVENATRMITSRPLTIIVNSADDIASQSLYLTVTGTSAEAGDDGEVGRGNRVNGLITPYRPMNMEAAAGKNPVTHVGKLYNIVAMQIAKTIVDTIPEVNEAYCYLVSQIGKPIKEPKVVDLKLNMVEDLSVASVQNQIEEIVQHQLSCIDDIRNKIIEGTLLVY